MEHLFATQRSHPIQKNSKSLGRATSISLFKNKSTVQKSVLDDVRIKAVGKLKAR